MGHLVLSFQYNILPCRGTLGSPGPPGGAPGGRARSPAPPAAGSRANGSGSATCTRAKHVGVQGCANPKWAPLQTNNCIRPCKHMCSK